MTREMAFAAFVHGDANGRSDESPDGGHARQGKTADIWPTAGAVRLFLGASQWAEKQALKERKGKREEKCRKNNISQR